MEKEIKEAIVKYRQKNKEVSDAYSKGLITISEYHDRQEELWKQIRDTIFDIAWIASW